MNEEIKKKLCEKYPAARQEFVSVLVDALDLHAKKNNDYNGSANKEYVVSKFETMAKMADVRRKYGRLFHLVAEQVDMKVDEQLEDTAIDLGNYAFLFTEYLRELKKTK